MSTLTGNEISVDILQPDMPRSVRVKFFIAPPLCPKCHWPKGPQNVMSALICSANASWSSKLSTDKVFVYVKIFLIKEDLHLGVEPFSYACLQAKGRQYDAERTLHYMLRISPCYSDCLKAEKQLTCGVPLLQEANVGSRQLAVVRGRDCLVLRFVSRYAQRQDLQEVVDLLQKGLKSISDVGLAFLSVKDLKEL